jgi:hypothetical protein
MSQQARSIVLALALVFLAAGAVQAWPAADGARTLPAAPTESVFAAAWDWIASQSIRPEAPTSQGSPGTIPQKSGCIMDPDGLPLLSLLCCNH